MSTYEPQPSQLHSPAWVAVTKIQFGVSVLALLTGLWYLPVEPWIVAYLVMDRRPRALREDWGPAACSRREVDHLRPIVD